MFLWARQNQLKHHRYFNNTLLHTHTDAHTYLHSHTPLSLSLWMFALPWSSLKSYHKSRENVQMCDYRSTADCTGMCVGGSVCALVFVPSCVDVRHASAIACGVFVFVCVWESSSASCFSCWYLNIFWGWWSRRASEKVLTVFALQECVSTARALPLRSKFHNPNQDVPGSTASTNPTY